MKAFILIDRINHGFAKGAEMMDIIKSCTINTFIAEDIKRSIMKAGISEPETDLVIEKITGILDDYAGHFGENTQMQYITRKRITKVETVFIIPGEPFDVFTDGVETGKRSYEEILVLSTKTADVHFKYKLKRNIVTVTIPLEEKRRHIFINPLRSLLSQQDLQLPHAWLC